MKRGASTVEVEGTQEIDGEEIEYEATVRVVYAPGVFSGPVERCYPDESETEIQELVTLPPGFEAKLDTEKIEDRAWEQFHEGE